MSKPYDFNQLLSQFSPEAVNEQLQKSLALYKIPNLNENIFNQEQQKNLNSLNEANQAAINSTQKLLKGQVEMLQEAFDEIASSAKGFSAAASPSEIQKAQSKLIEEAMQKVVSNATEVSEIISKAQVNASKVVTDRFDENMKELKKTLSM